MMLRSAAAAAVPARLTETPSAGEFIELRSDDASAKPWLAKVLGVRVTPSSDGPVAEVECEWLWHPQESVRDFGLDGVDPSLYGSREVFLSHGSGENTSDWNPVDSIKWRAYVLPLEEFKLLARNGYQMVVETETGGEAMRIVDSGRCWYYRQTLDPETRCLMPPLELSVHRPNPDYHRWCLARQIPVSTPPASDAPPRSMLVPENPERLYFHCTECNRKFETREGDMLDPQQIGDPKSVRLKAHVNQIDIDFICPYCKHVREGPPTKRVRRESADFWRTDQLPEDTVDPDRTFEMRAKRRQTKYERFNVIFQTSIDEGKAAGLEGRLVFTDAQELSDQFFDKFDSYAAEVQLNPKMCHQKLHEIFQNLKRENNVDLRRRVVTGNLSLDNLIRADVKDLAPDSLKRKREEEVRKYFEQQVLLAGGPESLRVIRKTHKGLEEVQDNEAGRARSPSPDDAAHEPGPETLQAAAGPVDYGSGLSLDIPSTMSVADIIKSVSNDRREKGVYSSMVDLPWPLISKWERASTLAVDPQVVPPSEYLGIPSRSQSYGMISEALGNLKLSDKLSSDLSIYATQVLCAGIGE